ncbi:MAG: GNAT family N-acetyltransferase [Chloroflexi bacterium]|nr:GNAT family N-acetyltransferase [Chloroflexota bacterium]
MPQPRIRRSRAEDVPAIEALLVAEHLPPYAIAEFLETFWVVEDGGRVVGSAGLEVYGEAGVLRSVVVQPGRRGENLGERLTRTALREARRRGVRRLYLFTMHAADFFRRFGFAECGLDEFDEAARQSFQYRAVSSMPELAGRLTAMRLDLT